MTDWLEAVAARNPSESHFRDGTVHRFTYITVAERDRLVKIARGVRELAGVCERDAYSRMGDEPQTAMHLARIAAELRKLEDV